MTLTHFSRKENIWGKRELVHRLEGAGISRTSTELASVSYCDIVENHGQIGPKVWNGSTSVGAAKGYESPVKVPFRLVRRMLGDISKPAWVRGVFSRGTVSHFTYGVVLTPVWTSDLSAGAVYIPDRDRKGCACNARSAACFGRQRVRDALC